MRRSGWQPGVARCVDARNGRITQAGLIFSGAESIYLPGREYLTRETLTGLLAVGRGWLSAGQLT